MKEKNHFFLSGMEEDVVRDLPEMVATARCDLRTGETQWSKEIYSFLEIDPGEIELSFERYLSFIVEEDREEAIRRNREILAGKVKEARATCRIKTPAGRIKQLLSHLYLDLDEKKKPIRLQIILINLSHMAGQNDTLRDISAKGSQMIDRSNDWMNRIFENRSAGIFILDKQGCILKYNQAFRGMIGYSEKELSGHSFLDLIPSEEREECINNMHLLIAGNKSEFVCEKNLSKKSGGSTWLEINASLIEANSDHILCFGIDINEKKQALEALEQNEKRLRLAQEVAHVGSWALDLITQEITWSREMYRILEESPDRKVDQEWALSIIHPEDRELFRKLTDTQTEFKDIEFRHLTRSGIKHLMVSAKLEFADGKPVLYHGILQDISQSRIRDTQLDQAHKVAKLGWYEANLITGEDLWSDALFQILELDQNSKPSFEEYSKIVHPEDLWIIRDNMTNPEKLKNGWHNVEVRHRKREGGYKYVLSSGQFIWNGDRPVRLIGTMMDITSSKELQLRLADYQKIGRLGWWEIDLQTGDAVWSDSIFDIMGIENRESGLSFDEYVKYVHPEDLKWIYKDPKELKDGWENVELRYKRPSGGTTYVLTSGQVIFNGETPIKMIGTNMDITATKETQQRLEQAQKIAKMGWWETDLQDPSRHWYSVEYDQILGITKEKKSREFRALMPLLHPEDQPKMLEALDNSVKNGGWKDLVFRIKTGADGYKYISSNATLETTEEKPSRLIGTIYDITDLKEIEAELIKNTVNLKALITSIEDCIFVINHQYVIEEVMADRHSHNKLYYEPAYLLNQRIQDVWTDEFPQGPKFVEKVKLAMEKGEHGTVEYRFAPKGIEFYLEAHFRPFADQENRKRVAVTIKDVTTRKKLEEEMIRSIQKEKELTEMRSQFVSMASHQFRTPLTVIKSNMQLLELLNLEHPTIKKVTGRLQSEVDRLVSLMEDILAMGKVQSGSVRPNFKKLDLVAIVKRLKLDIENNQPDGRILEMKVEGREKQLALDQQFIEHALSNLIDNAFKYSPNGSNPKITFSFRNEKVRIGIWDHGIGIPEPEQGKLFNTFQRGSNVQHISGTGLGLAVAKEFVTMNGGTLFLNTKCKEGTEFCIDLPYDNL